MYEPQRIRDVESPRAFELAELALNGRLAIYTGAGISRADPTDIPDGSEIARRCHARLTDILGPKVLDGANAASLTSVADTAAAALGNADLTKRTAAGVAEYTSAEPNFSHQALGLLLLEGLLDAITTNWDNCIERSVAGEQILAVISDQDRQEIEPTALFKVHGCATRPATLRITTAELEDPPAWVRDIVNVRLSDSVVVFVGIGDVAGYVRNRIEEVKQAVGTREALFVVSPGIEDYWQESQWAAVLPELEGHRRIATTSDEFLDELAAACIRLTLRGIQEALREERETLEAFNRSQEAVDALTSIDALQWFRGCSVPRAPGASVMKQQAFSTALVALGFIGQYSGVAFDSQRRVVAGDAAHEVLIACGTVGAARLQREARARLVKNRTFGDEADEPVFVVAGAMGRIGFPTQLPEDVLDAIESDDVVAGPLAGTPRIIRAEDVAP